MDTLIFDYVTEKLNNVEKDPSDDISFYEAISSLSYTTDASEHQKNLLFSQLTNTKRSIPRYLGSIFSIEEDSEDICVDTEICLYYTIYSAMDSFTGKIHGNGKIKVIAKLEKITDILSRISNIKKLDNSFNGMLYTEYTISLSYSSTILHELYSKTHERINIEDAYYCMESD